MRSPLLARSDAPAAQTDQPLLVRSFKVGACVVTITAPPIAAGGAAKVAIEWSPALPGRLDASEMRQYVDGRDAAMRELMAALLMAPMRESSARER